MAHTTGAQDPLVRILPARLEEARKAVGLSVRALARKAGVNQQTVDAMLHSRGAKRRCRQSIRDKLAKALDLPTYQGDGSRWLGGEVYRIQDGSLLGNPHPSGADLARLRLMDRCRAAWTRDKEQAAAAAALGRPDTIPESARFHQFQHALEKLSSFIWWRGQVYATRMFVPTRAEYEASLQSLPKDARKQIRENDRKHRAPLIWDEMTAEAREDWLKWPREATPPDFTDEQLNQFELGFVRGLEALLEPWLSGEADIRYAWLVALQAEGNRLGRELW